MTKENGATIFDKVADIIAATSDVRLHSRETTRTFDGTLSINSPSALCSKNVTA
jgi:hypothetical protein